MSNWEKNPLTLCVLTTRRCDEVALQDAAKLMGRVAVGIGSEDNNDVLAIVLLGKVVELLQGARVWVKSGQVSRRHDAVQCVILT